MFVFFDSSDEDFEEVEILSGSDIEVMCATFATLIIPSYRLIFRWAPGLHFTASPKAPSENQANLPKENHTICICVNG